MTLTMEHPEDETLYIMKEYYRLNMEPFFSALSDDCVWILPSDHVASGAEAIRSMFKNGIVMPPFRLENARFRSAETGSHEQKTVYGIYDLLSEPSSGMIMAARQRATFCYRREEDRWLLYHLHVSVEWSQPPEGQVFPVDISRQTYTYLQRLLVESQSRKKKQTIALRDKKGTNIIDPALVQYAEATDKATVLHMMDQTLLIHTPFKEIVSAFPEYFVRVHRSHLVNSRCVVRIERFFLTLTTGAKLPIPEKRYTQARREILEHTNRAPDASQRKIQIAEDASSAHGAVPPHDIHFNKQPQKQVKGSVKQNREGKK